MTVDPTRKLPTMLMWWEVEYLLDLGKRYHALIFIVTGWRGANQPLLLPMRRLDG